MSAREEGVRSVSRGHDSRKHPDFAGFYDSLVKEIRWLEKSDPSSVTHPKIRSLHRLADHVLAVKKFLESP